MLSGLLRQLCIFSGEDYFIVRKCKFNIQLRFALIGFFVALVFAGCFASAALFVAHLFHGSRGVCFIAGSIWAMMITNLYLLLLYTVTPSLLPVAQKQNSGAKGIKQEENSNAAEQKYRLDWSFSYVFRLSLIGLLAIIVIQPFNVLLFSPSFEQADRYANEIKRILHEQPLSWFVSLLGCTVFLLPVYYKFHIRTLSKKNYEEDFGSVDTDLLLLRDEIVDTDNYQQLSLKIRTLDMSRVKTSDFYFQKMLIEMRLVLEEYELFKSQYSELLTWKIRMCNQCLCKELIPVIDRLKDIRPEQYKMLLQQVNEEINDVTVYKYEYWADAPFRTKYRCAQKDLPTEQSLLDSFYKHDVQ